MKRKVAKIGPSTLMVSLPAKWAKENGLKKGDELNLAVDKKEIIFSLEENKRVKKEVVLDITDLNKFLLIRYLETFYLNNYDSIKLTYSKPEIFRDKIKEYIPINQLIKELSQRFIGMEIVNQTRNMTELRCFLLEQEQDLENIGRRIFYLFKSITQEFLQSLEKGRKEFHLALPSHHDTISRFIYYYLRVLDQSGKSEAEKKQLFNLYLIIDKMMDKLRHLEEAIVEKGCSKKVKRLLHEIFSLSYGQFEALQKGKIGLEIVAKRYDLMKKLDQADYTAAELKAIKEVKIFLDNLHNFSWAAIAKELNQ